MEKSSMLLHDSVNRRKAKTGSLACLLGREKRLEDAFQRLRIHAATGIGNGKHRVPPGGDSGIETRVRFIDFDNTVFDQKASAGGHRVSCIDAKIHQYLFHLSG